MGLENLVQELKAAKETFVAKAKDAMLEHVKAFFEKFPEVSLIKWEQYTPGYNDGDPCVFRLGDIRVILGEKKTKDEDEDEDEDDYGLEDYQLRKTHPELAADVEKMNSLWEEMEDELQTIFGDGVRVKIERDGTTTVDEYEHD